MNRFALTFALVILAIALSPSSAANAQSTYFNYQGSLEVDGVPADGTYDLEFQLYDSLENGNPVGNAVAAKGVQVSNGSFTVALDFGDVFPGDDRFLEVRVQASGALEGGADSLTSHTVLTPRQRIGSAPYSIRSKSAETSTSADQLGGVDASQYVITSDPRLSDARPPTPGSADYIQNSTILQSSSNFRISGTGRADVFKADTQYNIGDSRFIGAVGVRNTFLGFGTGSQITTGGENTFVGACAGCGNTTGFYNSFLGRWAGYLNSTGHGNSYFGNEAGTLTESGSYNSFFGHRAGYSNTVSDSNSIFGAFAGEMNTANGNSFFGRSAGGMNTSGHSNSFFGVFAGDANTEGDRNSYFGESAGTNATGSDNSLFGSSSGVALTTGFGNAFFGVNSGNATTTGQRNTFVGPGSGNVNTTGNYNVALGRGANMSANNLTYATAIGSDTIVTASNRVQLGRNGTDTVSVGMLTTASGTHLCINGTVLSSCSSSIRYKESIFRYSPDTENLLRLMPVTFRWKTTKELDFGLIAEEVEKIEPMLVTYNTNGQVEGVHYERIGVLLLNVVKEQQDRIGKLEAENRAVKDELAALKGAVCSIAPESEACK